MQDKQNRGIGAYRDRPGYFMGGMIGGAILGALVNKIQGKDVKRGLAWGALGGAGGEWATKAFGPGSGKFVNFLKKGSPGYKKLPWYNKLLSTLGTSMGEYSKYLPSVVGTGAGLGISQLMSDPEWEARKIRAEKERRLREQMARNRSFYPNWYRNPWTGNEMNPYGLNTGGMINARQGYPGGGSATLEYTDPDLYTPTGEGGGPSSSPILQIPLGPEGSFAEEFEDLDLASGPSGSDMSGWYEMYDDLKSKGELPDWMDSFELFMQNLDVLDISPTDFSARGGYKTRPKYAGGGMTDAEKKAYQGLLDSGYTEDEAVKIIELHGSDYGGLQVPGFLKSQAGKAEGGIADLDMTGGGASFGPGTGTSDDIPAMLSDGEFVVTAKAVENLGGGDRMLGARKMYQMMNQLDPNSQTPAEMSGVGYA
jgi:hypothetical protein